MNKIVVAAALAFAAAGLAPAAPAQAQNRDALRAKCKQMLKQSYGIQKGETRRGKTGGGASVYYSQVETCVANGGRI